LESQSALPTITVAARPSARPSKPVDATIIDMTHSTDARISSRVEFETLISDTVAKLFAASAGTIDGAIERALTDILQFFQVDRCMLLSVSPDQQSVRIAFAAYSEGTPSVSGDIDLPTLFPWSRRTLLLERKPIRYARRAEIPESETVERASSAALPIQAALTIPIEARGAVTHLMLLNTLHRECEWPDYALTRLCLLGQVLVDAVERHKLFIDLRDAEERLTLAADSADAGLWSLDSATGLIWTTPKARLMFGYSADSEVTADMVRSSIHAEDRDSVQLLTDAANLEGRPFNIEYRIVLADGRIRWISTAGRPHFAPTGEPDRVMGVSIDITERRLAQESLKRSESRLAAGVELAGLGFYEVDFTAGVIFTDDRFCRLCGLTPEWAYGLQPLEFWRDHVHRDDLPYVMEMRRRLHEGDTDQVSLEYRYLHPTEGQKWIHHLGGVAERDTTRRAIRTYGVLRDITVRRQAEEALRESYEEVQRLRDRLQAEGEYLKSEMRVALSHGQVTGESPGIRKVLHLVEQVASTGSSVLILGETGTGKELIAQSIHQNSQRRANLMVKVNCAALPSGLVESELFGRERGAFTGAMTRQVGRFEIADGSTIFLDEIGELPLELQSKLLRVLESGEFERLGSPRTIKVDVRLIAATNRNLPEMIKLGKFREDLYYRLNVFPIRVPPLRERTEDIPVLVWTFLEEFCTRMGKRINQVPRKTIEILQRQPWPGNVRELRNTIEHAAIISSGDTLRIPALDQTSAQQPGRHTLADAERDHIVQTLERSGWRIKGAGGAAILLGINPATLYSRMKKLGIKPPRAGEGN
jgi:PAS domain S-box-containing protein